MSHRSAPAASKSLIHTIPALELRPRQNPIAVALALALALALGLFGLSAGSVQAATISVTTTDQASATACTLSDAIVAANSDEMIGACPAGNGADTIVLPDRTTFTFTFGAGDDTALPFISSEVVIQGNGSTITRAPTAPEFRLLGVSSTGNLSLHQATVSGGQAPSLGGGGIYVDSGSLDLVDSTVSGNRTAVANGRGGGILSEGGTVTLTNSTVSGNSAERFGGGISSHGIFADAVLTLTNSTVSGNSILSTGGGLFLSNTSANLTRSSVSGNIITGPSGFGSEVAASGSTIIATRSLFGHSGLNNGSAFAGFSPDASNLTATSDGNTPTALTSILDTTLADNGGPTQTHALVAGSPAIDAAPSVDCSGSTDQRGVNRPKDGNTSASTSECDLGAYEFGTNNVDLAVALTVNPPTVLQGAAVSLSYTVTNAGPENASDVELFVTVPSLLTLGGPLPSGCAIQSGDLSCTLGGLASGGSAIRSFSATASAVGAAAVSGYVISSTLDSDTDPNNNAASQNLMVDEVVGPDYSGHIQQPINANGSSTFNSKRGVVPVKFALKVDGVSTCTLPPATIRVIRTAGGGDAVQISESTYLHASDSGSDFRIQDCQYHYNINAKSFGSGEYTAELLIDGRSEGIAAFELK